MSDSSVRWKRLVCLVVAATLSFAAYESWSDHPVAFDDAYITFRYSDNLVAGHGPVYNRGERVEGYTNFSWMLLAAAGIASGHDPFDTTRAVGLTCHLLMLFGIGWLFTSWSLRQGWVGLLLLPTLYILIRPKSFVAMAGSGLETPFVAALLVATAMLVYAGDFSRRRTYAALSLVLSLAVLTRMDCVLAVGAAAIAIAYGELRAGAGFKRAAQAFLGATVPVGLVVLAWTAWRYTYYGQLLPNTYYAKGADEVHIEEGLAYLKAFWEAYPLVVPLTALTVVGLGSHDPRLRRLAIFATITLTLEAIYTVKVGGDFMEYRFVWHQYGLMVLAALGALISVAARSLPTALALALISTALPLQPTKLEKRFGMQSIDEMHGYVRSGEAMAKRLDRVLPKDTVIATTLAGAFGYFTKLTVIDQWGLNDYTIARQPLRHFSRGHVKFSNMEYLRSRRVNLYIHHPVICSCTNPCREDKPNIFVRLDGGRCLRSWYLTQTEALTKHVCEHPKDFLLNRVKCQDAKPKDAKPKDAKPTK